MARSLLRTIFWILALACLTVAAFRIAADQREVFSADELLPPGGAFHDTVHGRIHALERGPVDGPVVLLIHGSVGWSGLWDETLDDLATRGFRAIAIDLPPMGLSDRDNRTDYSRQAQGLRVLGFVEARGIKPIIVAHSFGAGAAVEAIMTDAEAFAGAVIVAGALTLDQDGTGQELPWPLASPGVREFAVANTVTNPYLTQPLFSRFVHRHDAITDDQIANLQYPFTRFGTTDTIARWLPSLLIPPRGASSTDPTAYGTLDLPFALIWGREDTVTPPDQAVQLQDALGDVPLFWLDDVGHIPQIENTPEFHRTLAEALSALTAQ